MKHLYLTFFALLLGAMSYGQSLELSETFFEFGVDEGFDFGEVTLTNISSETITVTVRSERRCHADDGSGLQFCFGPTCFGPYDYDYQVTAGQLFQTLEPGESTDQLTAHLFDYVAEGSAWRVYYYDPLNTSDEVYFDVIFGSCSDQYTIVSVSEMESADFNVFPNPATDNVTIDFETQNGGSYVIYDLTGNIVARDQSASSLLNVDVSSLSSGIYFIQVGELRKRLVIN